MKIYRQLLILLSIISWNVYSAPSLHLKYLTVIAEQGSEIYGNGLMQSKIRIDYSLHDDVQLTLLRLKEYETGSLLSAIGWNESDTDNGYDHNIEYIGQSFNASSSQDPIVEFRPVESKSNVNQYKYKYLSTSKSNAFLTLCVEATTKKGGETKTYSTCYDPGIYHGKATIYAHSPLKYYESDFKITDKIEVVLKMYGAHKEYEKYLLIAYTQSLVADNFTTRSKTFKVLNRKVLTDPTFISGKSNESGNQYKKFEPPSSKQEKPEPYIGYSGYYLYKQLDRFGKPADYINFEYYDPNSESDQSFLVRSYTPNSIVNILRVDYFKNAFMLAIDHAINAWCEKNKKGITEDRYFLCSYIGRKGSYLKPHSIIYQFRDKAFMEILLEDNYGNRFTYVWDIYEKMDN